MSEEQESLIDFPCDFMIKAMGKTQSDFQQCVMDIGHRHDPKFNASRVTARESKNGTYTSLSLTVFAESKPHLDAIYQDLHDNEHVLWGNLNNTLVIRKLGLSDYQTTWQAMQDFTRNRTPDTPDELWVLEHPPVFTLGTNGKPEHILNAGDIPVVNIDRGGQVTYHGPGQLVIYLLLNLHRRKLGIRKLVTIIEETIITLLARHQVTANSDPNAPGVYVNDKKIAALGLRVSRGFSSHGLSLNVDMDLAPFQRINPCGYQGLEIIQCRDFGITLTADEIADELITLLQERLPEPL